MPSKTITLGEIAHARSGDKGNHANVGVIAYTPAGYEFLEKQLTNFMLYNALGGGASQSLRIDTQGKLLGTAVLELELPRPENLAPMLRPEV